MSTARSMPQRSRYFRKAWGERQNSTIWSKFGRCFCINASAPGLNISMGWIWMWQSVIKAASSYGNNILDKSKPLGYSGLVMKEPRTLQEAIKFFANPDNALAYMVRKRWPDGVVACPKCG